MIRRPAKMVGVPSGAGSWPVVTEAEIMAAGNRGSITLPTDPRDGQPKPLPKMLLWVGVALVLLLFVKGR